MKSALTAFLLIAGALSARAAGVTPDFSSTGTVTLNGKLAIDPRKYVEKDGRAVFRQLQDSGAFARRPSAKPPRKRLAAHPDLIERGLDLVEGQLAFGR